MYCPARKLRPLWLIPHNWVAALPASSQHPALCSRAADAADGLQAAVGRSTTCRSEQTAVWTCSITTQSQGHSQALLSVCPTILLRRGKLTMKHWNIRCMKLWKNLSMRSYFHYVTFFSLVEGFHLSASLSKAPNCVLWQERGRRTHNFVPMWRLTLILTGQWRVLIKFLQQQRQQQQQRMMQFWHYQHQILDINDGAGDTEQGKVFIANLLHLIDVFLQLIVISSSGTISRTQNREQGTGFASILLTHILHLTMITRI